MNNRLFTAIVFAGAVLYGANLTFHASFDNGVSADFAQGSSEPVEVLSDVACQEDGILGKCVKIGPWKDVETPGTTEIQDRDYRYVYNAAKNLNAAKGAMSFWVKPVDWDGKDVGPHRLFVQLVGPNRTSMTIYKVMNNSSLYCHIVSQGTASGKAMGRINGWKNGVWHHIVVCWSKGALNTFIDSVQSGSMSYTDFSTPITQIHLGKLGWLHQIGASCLDDFRVYDAPLTMSEIEALYNKGNVGDKRRMSIALGRAKNVPVMDGSIDKDEYLLGATGFFQFKKNDLNPQNKQVEYYLSQDGEKLYIGMASPAPAKPKMQVYLDRDGNVWEDETVEIHFDVIGKKHYQFIMNPADGIFDSCNGDPKWNSPHAVHKSTLKDGRWTFEFAIPFADLELTGDALGINLCRSYQTPLLLSSMAPVKTAYADYPNFCQVKLLKEELPPMQLASLDGLNRKRLELSARSTAGGKCTVSYGDSGRDEIALEDSTKSISKENLPAACPVTVTLSTPDGKEVYCNTFEVLKRNPVAINYIYTDMATDTIKIALTSLLDKSERGILKLDISKRFGDELVESVEIPLSKFDDSFFEVEYPAAKLPLGPYVLDATYISPVGESTTVFKEEWLKPEKQKLIDYTADEMVKLQPPWKPLVLNGETVSTAFNECSFGNGYLSQVTSLEHELFANASFIEIDGQREAMFDAPVFDNHGDYCKVTQRAEYGGVAVQLESRMEFDGLVKTRMTILPKNGGSKVLTMRLCFPLKTEHVKYVNAFNEYGNEWGKSGVLSDDKEWRTDIFKLFSFWIGDEQSGFSFVCRNAKGWHCKETGKSFQLMPANDGSRLAVLNLVDTEFALKEPRTIEFAVMASPSRPLSPELLRTQFRVWQMWSGSFSTFYDYHEPGYLLPKPGNPNFFHYIGVGISPHCAAFNYYQEDWNRGTLGAVSEDIVPKNLEERNKVHYWSACLNSNSFLNYKIDRVKYVINQDSYNVHNLYFDLLRGQACSSKGHGCFWKDDFGREWKSFDWEGRRILLRELRAELLKRNPKGYISLHSHYQRLPMVLSFGDMHVGGEDFVFEVGKTGNYYDIVNSPILRAYSIAYGSGLKCIFIPQLHRSLYFIKPGTTFDEKLPKNITATRHIALMLLIHDIDGWTAMGEFIKIWNLQSEFGWDKSVVFEPFWNNHGLFDIMSDSSGKVIASVFRRDGRFLLAMLNDSYQESDVTIRLDFKHLLGKDAPSIIKDFYAPNATHTAKDGMLELNFPPREGTILWFE